MSAFFINQQAFGPRPSFEISRQSSTIFYEPTIRHGEGVEENHRACQCHITLDNRFNSVAVLSFRQVFVYLSLVQVLWVNHKLD
jgi:hypothetical protein